MVEIRRAFVTFGSNWFNYAQSFIPKVTKLSKVMLINLFVTYTKRVLPRFRASYKPLIMLTQINSKIAHLHTVQPTVDYDQLTENWLSQKRSHSTKRVYKYHLNCFLEASGLSLGHFLSLTKPEAFKAVSIYKGDLVQRKLTPATINSRLAAIKGIVNFAYNCGHCEYVLDTVKSERMSKYRDTTGVSLDSYRNMLAVPDTSKINGLRDYAILHLLWSNALRRAEVVKCDVGDFDFKGRKLRILGKGRNEYEWVELSSKSAIALNIYLDARGDVNQNEPLFISHQAPYTGQRLSDGFVYKMVRETAKKAGIAKAMSPHRVRHSAITTALDATGGDVRSVQKLSRHSNINTLLIYDDNRQNAQGKMSRILGDML